MYAVILTQSVSPDTNVNLKYQYYYSYESKFYHKQKSGGVLYTLETLYSQKIFKNPRKTSMMDFVSNKVLGQLFVTQPVISIFLEILLSFSNYSLEHLGVAASTTRNHLFTKHKHVIGMSHFAYTKVSDKLGEGEDQLSRVLEKNSGKKQGVGIFCF